jgi:hypothetical protein
VILLMINVTGYHLWCPKHGLCVLLVISGPKPQIFDENLWNCYHAVNSIVFWITKNPCFTPTGNFKVTIFWKLMENATKWAMIALWPMGRYWDIMGQNHKILLKIAKYWEKCIIIFFTSLLNPCESSYDKCHRLSLLMSQTRFVCSIGHFGEKPQNFYENIWNIYRAVNISLLNHK